MLDYSEPYVRARAPIQRRPVLVPGPNSGRSSSSTRRNPAADDDDDDDDENPTPEEFLAAFLQIQRAAETAQEKARLEALVRARLEQQERNKREAFAHLYLRAIAEKVEEAAAEQEKQRQQAALVKFFRDLGLQ